jgi:hypothetical protein
MATFNTKKILYASPSLIPAIAERISDQFRAEGYEVNSDQLSNGGYDISLRKGGFFKSVLGMKSALKISLQPRNNEIAFEAGVGIFGQQVIPTAISMFFFWPVLITQIWGMVKQSKLDDQALQIAEEVIYYSNSNNNCSTNNYANTAKRFCTACGVENKAEAKFCNACGTKLD